MDKDDLSIRELNIQKKMLKCQVCGKLFLTDRCHRTCAKCKAALAHQDQVLPKIYTVSGKEAKERLLGINFLSERELPIENSLLRMNKDEDC